MVYLAALPGQLKLRREAPLRILVDNSVLRHGLTHSNAWVSTGTVLWGGEIPVETGYRARVPINYTADQCEIFEREVPFFAPLASLAARNYLKLFTSNELLNERNRHPSYNRFQFGMNVWSKVPIEILPDLPRSLDSSYMLSPKSLREYWSKQGQARRITESADPDFIRVLKKLPQEHVLDFYYLWTAKKSNCSIFLTTDKQLQRILANNISPSVRQEFEPVRCMSPSQLANDLGLHAVRHEFLTPIDIDWFYEMRRPMIVKRRPRTVKPVK